MLELVAVISKANNAHQSESLKSTRCLRRNGEEIEGFVAFRHSCISGGMAGVVLPYSQPTAEGFTDL